MSIFNDLAYMRSFDRKYTPCYVKYDEVLQRYTKVPAIKDWTNITPERSKELLESEEFAGHKHFIFLCGDETGLFVIDIDRKHANRADHLDKIDGVEGFETWCGPVDAPDTFTSRSINGGFHKVYQITEELSKFLKNGKIDEKVLCEILHNKRGFMFGEGCEIIHRMLPQPPPAAVYNLIINNQVNMTINNTTINSVSVGGLPSPESVTAVLEPLLKASWKITQENTDTYVLVPQTRQCCVESNVEHTQSGHSCVYVHRNSVVSTCFSHGKRMVRNEVGQQIRALFFVLKGERQDGVKKLVEELLTQASDEMLARENGMVLKRISRLVPVYEHLEPYEAFVTARLANHAQLRAYPRHFNDVMVYMTHVADAAFPFIKRDKTYIGFRNGMLNLVSGELEYYGSLQPGVSPRHYIDQVCQFDDLSTPLFDQIFSYQLDTGDDAVYTYFLGLIGRLFYPVGDFDSFDVMPFVVGDTNTGKSTLVDIVSAMFSPSSVGVVDSGHEIIFGLQAMNTKEVILAAETPDNMAQQLASDKFKKMVCGETIIVPIKHAAAETVQWKVPMLMCGNDYPRYRDERGSISKRLAIFSFTRFVAEQDSSLKRRILEEELARLVVKCLLAYRQLVSHTGTAGFWARCPAYFQENTASMQETTDYVHMFLTLGSGENMWFDKSTNCRKTLYFVQRPGHTLWMEEFKKKFQDYMHFRHPQVKHTWTKDYATFKRLGYLVERRNMCRACKFPARVGCCAYFSHANRSNVDAIMNIVCVEELSEV